jgi:hypothetical protein
VHFLRDTHILYTLGITFYDMPGMEIQNPKSKIQNRKGIFQAFDAAGNVTADERWRITRTLGGGVRIDTDTVRIAPFTEPRNESFSLELGSNLAYSRLAIHAARDRRESRADFTADRASICWRINDTSRTRDYDLATDCEIGYNSPLFNMITLWRHPLAVSESSALRVIALDNVTFEPSWLQQSYSNLGVEQHETRFGLLSLVRYQVDWGGTNRLSQFWCDATGVVFDFKFFAGGGFKLVAVNFPGEISDL